MHALRAPRNGPPSWRRPPLLKWLRRPVVYWSCFAVLLAATVAAMNLGEDVDPQLDPNREVEVLVAQRLIRPGETLDEEAVTTDSRPESLVPPGRVEKLEDGDVASSVIYPGEVVLSARLRGRGGLSGEMPTGSVALSFPKSADVPPVQPGDLVRLLAAYAPEGDLSPEEFHTVSVAAEAWVVAADEESVTVAMRPREAAAAVVPKLLGTLTLAALAHDQMDTAADQADAAAGTAARP